MNFAVFIIESGCTSLRCLGIHEISRRNLCLNFKNAYKEKQLKSFSQQKFSKNFKENTIEFDKFEF